MTDHETLTYNDRYELQHLIARGGMAEVFLARDLLLARPVALKVLFPEFAGDPSFVARFRREAQAAANLSHPNVVGVYDWGQEGSTYYIVMEYVDGKSLSDILRSEGIPPPDAAAGIAADVAAALGFAHRSGVVHRDIKPGNIMITGTGHVKVADFGIARAIAGGAEENLTRTGAVMGTATYFSPEQAQGHAVDPRSDLYSLGVVMYEMGTGQTPFTGDSPVAIAYKHVQERPVPPRLVNPAVPEPYEAITLKLLAKQPADRYASAEDLRTDLRRFMRGQPVTAAPAPRVPQPVAAPAPTVASPRPPVYAEVATPPRRTGWFIAVLLVLLLVLGGLLYAFARTLGIVGGTDKVAVPSVVNENGMAAAGALKKANLGFETTRQSSPSVPEDIVISQDPAPGTEVEEGSTVNLVLSSGPPAPETKPVPDVRGLPELDARRQLNDAGFRLVNSRQENALLVPKGSVIRQNPSPGLQPVDTPIELVVSSGPPPTTAPPSTSPPSTEAPTTLPPPTEPPPTEPPPTEPPPTEPPPTEPPSTEPPSTVPPPTSGP